MTLCRPVFAGNLPRERLRVTCKESFDLIKFTAYRAALFALWHCNSRSVSFFRR